MITKASCGEMCGYSVKTNMGSGHGLGAVRAQKNSFPPHSLSPSSFLLSLPRSAPFPTVCPTVPAPALFVLFLLNSYPGPPCCCLSLSSPPHRAQEGFPYAGLTCPP